MNQDIQQTDFLPRSITSLLSLHLATMPVVVLSGARQTGKSTLAKIIGEENRQYHALDDFDTLSTANRDPQALIGGTTPVTLDEIQRAPNLLTDIKLEVDRNRQAGRFLLIGSTHLLLMEKVSESLAGRASYINLWPMTRREQMGMGRCGVWDKLIDNRKEDWLSVLDEIDSKLEDWRELAQRGGLPEPATRFSSDTQRQIWFEAYVRTYLERDLQQLSAVASLPDFAKLVRVLCQRLGCLSNQTDLARDTAISQPTVYRYLNLLEASCLLIRLQPFFVNRTKRLVKSPKLYFCDSGVALNISGQQEPSGAHLENLILHDLLAWKDSQFQKAGIYYWRTIGGEEVDFVIESNERVLPIEVKASKRPHIGDSAKLRIFLKEYEDLAQAGVLLHTGNETKWLTPNVLSVPWWRVI